MKYIFLYLYVLFFKIINSFTPFIRKYNFFKNTCDKARGIIKSFSGFLQCIPYIKSNHFINAISIIETETETECGLYLDSESELELETKKCKIKMIVPGYIDHDPKAEAFNLKLKLKVS